MIPNETRVKVNMKNESNSVLIELLNSLGGQVIKGYPENPFDEPNYLVAYDAEHLSAIQEATNKHFGTKVKVQLDLVGLNRNLGMPKDPRFYLMAHHKELTPV